MKKHLALIIEDDPDLSEIFAMALEVVNFETEVIHDGGKALARLAEIAPSLIILDLHLPHLSGENVLRQIHSDRRLIETRVVVATADAAMADELRDKADLVLLKPLSFSQLQDLAVRLVPSVTVGRTAKKQEEPEILEKPGEPEKSEKLEKPEALEKPEKLEESEKPKELERLEKPQDSPQNPPAS